MQTPRRRVELCTRGRGESSSNSSPTFISSDSEGCTVLCSMATVSRKSSPEEAGSETFNQSGSLARQNVLSLALQPPWAQKGKGMTLANTQERLSEERDILLRMHSRRRTQDQCFLLPENQGLWLKQTPEAGQTRLQAMGVFSIPLGII